MKIANEVSKKKNIYIVLYRYYNNMVIVELWRPAKKHLAGYHEAIPPPTGAYVSVFVL